jgi:hypothetical protein
MQSEIERAIDRHLRLHGHLGLKDHVVRFRSAIVGYTNIGLCLDGTITNPGGHPEEGVRTFIEAYLKKERVKREASAKRGAEARERRRRDRLWAAVKAWKRGQLTPASKCRCCRKPLSDPDSLARGIRRECWEHILVWEHRAECEVAAQGVDRLELFREIAGLRVRLAEHAEECLARRITESEGRYRAYLTRDRERWLPVYERPKAERLRLARYYAEHENRRHLRVLDRVEDQLGFGEFDDHAQRDLAARS